jgi:hypothetical protein
VQEVPSAADVVLAGPLDAPPGPARVAVATPLAAYATHAGGILGLLAPAAARVPGGLVVPPPLLARLRPGDELVVGGGGVVLPGNDAGVVRLVVRRWWDSRVPLLRAPVPPPPDPAVDLPDAVRAGSRILHESLARGADVQDAVRALIGLGPGLTPAGDDVLAGVVVALVAAGDAGRARPVLDGVRACRHRTTALSAALLGHAAGGRAVPQLARYLHAPADPRALADLLRVGGTSGSALALGARIGLSVAAARMASPADREVA